MVLLQIALGGAIGAVLRYGVGQWAVRALGSGFPYGTLLVNAVGSAAMGVAAVWLLDRGDPRLAPLVMTGILGGFTTFSAFSLDALQLAEAGRWTEAAIYIGASVVLSVGALVIAILLARGLIT